MSSYKYHIKQIGKNKCLIIGKDYSRFEEYLMTITEDLKQNHFNGEVILDLLLANGNANNCRFFSILFMDVFQLKTLKSVSNPPKSILNYSHSYFVENKEILKEGVLSQTTINIILNSDF